jgi:hypothetical protein
LLEEPKLEDIPGHSVPLRLKITEAICKGWAFKFRQLMPPKLPIDKIAEFFCSDNGRPTKNLRAMTGLAVLQELFSLTDAGALYSLLTDLSYQVALAVPAATDDELYISPRTYLYFRKDLQAMRLGGLCFEEIARSLISQFKVELKLRPIGSVNLPANMITGPGAKKAAAPRFARAGSKTGRRLRG